jgi:hypothetical protein
MRTAALVVPFAELTEPPLHPESQCKLGLIVDKFGL